MKIRDLTAADLFKLIEIADAISADLMEKITEEISEKKLGLQIAMSILKLVPTEIKAFLAYVTDQTPEELDQRDFSEPIQILRALYGKQEFKDFLLELNSLKSEILQKSAT